MQMWHLPSLPHNLLLSFCIFATYLDTLREEVTGADPGFFLGGGALVSCSTSTPINHRVFSQNISCIRKPQVISGGKGGGCAPPAPSPSIRPCVSPGFNPFFRPVDQQEKQIFNLLHLLH